MTDDKLLEVIERAEPPAVTTSYVAERVDIGSERCRQRLNALTEQPQLKREKCGNIILYWKPS